MFCAVPHATENHRSCRQVNAVSNITFVTNTKGILKQLTEVKNYIEELERQHQKNNQDIQLHINASIPKQVQEMRASINKTLDKLEDLLMSEAKMIGKNQIERGNSEISRWQFHVRTVNDQANLFAVAQQNGAEIHKCIAAKC